MTEAVACLITIVEIVCFCTAGMIHFMRWGNTLAESISYGIVSTLMGLSFLFQAAFLIKIPFLSFFGEAIWFVFSCGSFFYCRSQFKTIWRTISTFSPGHPIAAAGLLFLWLYLGLMAIVLPPSSQSWAGLTQVILIQQNGLFPGIQLGTPGYFLNDIILGNIFLRWQTDLGIGFLNLMAYFSIGFSTYALSRRYAWPPTAFTVTMVAMSMPRVVFQSTSFGNELISSAAFIFSILALYRTVEQPSIRDFFFFFWGILFGISNEMMSLAMTCILFLLGCVLLFRRHGFVTWLVMIRKNRIFVIAALCPAFIYSQIWLFLYGLILQNSEGYNLIGDFMINEDGIQGAFANLIRYLIESCHFTHSLETVFRGMGLKVLEVLQHLYDLFMLPVFGHLGASEPFYITSRPDETYSWFGPFSFFLIYPGLLYALTRGPRRLKGVAMALLGYFYIVTLIPAWAPGNARYFTCFYICGVFFISFLLPPWRFTRRGKRILQSLCILLLFYTSFFNAQRPALGHQALFNSVKSVFSKHAANADTDFMDVFKDGIWVRSRWGKDRYSVVNEFFGDKRVSECSKMLPEKAKVGVIFKDPSLLYPYFKAFTSAFLIPIPMGKSETGSMHGYKNLEYLLFLDRLPETQLLNYSTKVLWNAKLNSRFPDSTLVQILH